MSKISKTARASMGQQGPKEVKVIPDAELIRLLRIDRAAGIYPGTQGTDAVLRAFDQTAAALKQEAESLALVMAANDALRARVEDLGRQLVLANSIIETKHAALTQIATVAGLDPTTFDLDTLRAETGADSTGE